MAPRNSLWRDAEIELCQARIAAISEVLTDLQDLVPWLNVIESAPVAQAMQALNARRRAETKRLGEMEAELRRLAEPVEA